MPTPAWSNTCWTVLPAFSVTLIVSPSAASSTWISAWVACGAAQAVPSQASRNAASKASQPREPPRFDPGAWRGWYNRILSFVGHDGHLAIFDRDAVDH